MPIHGLAPSPQPLHPAHFDIERVIRPNILSLHPYRCARDDYKEGILLDANENALGHSLTHDSSLLQPMEDLDLHRYPDPSHDQVKERIATLRGLPAEAIDHIFLGVGSDEVIDLLMRLCVVPGKERVLITPPTYGMYAVCAQVNDVGVVRCPLELSGDGGEGGERGRFGLRVDEVCDNCCISYYSNRRVAVLIPDVLGEKGCRCRSIHQAYLSLLSRKSNWNTHSLVSNPSPLKL